MSNIHFKYAENIIEYNLVYNLLKDVQDIYPDFHFWYFNKVLPSVMLKNDKIILCYCGDDVVGFAITKTNEEEKLRCFRILPKYQKTRFVLKFFDFVLKEFKNRKPLLSVSEDYFHSFSRLFINHYKFNLTKVYKNLYKKNKLEYEFNGENSDLEKTFFPY